MPELKLHDLTGVSNKSWVMDHPDKDNSTVLRCAYDEEGFNKTTLPDMDITWPTRFAKGCSKREYSNIITYIPHSDPHFQQQHLGQVYLFEPTTSKLKVKLGGQTICYLDYRFEELNNEIEKSKYILALEDDFDDDGSEGYKSETWVRAIKFICQLFDFALIKSNLKLPVPKILHGPSGSIDIYWENDDFNILVNIPKIDTPYGTYSGENKFGEKTKGQFDPSNINYGIVFLFSMIK